MNAFPLLAAFTICVSFAVLYSSFQDLRQAPLTLDRSTVPMREVAAHRLNPGAPLGGLLHKTAAVPPQPGKFLEADEGLLDHELASEDPLQAWLDRYLTPPTE